MVMGVDQPGQHNMGRGIERSVYRCCGRFPGWNQFCNELIFNDKTTLGIVRIDSQWITNPGAGHAKFFYVGRGTENPLPDPGAGIVNTTISEYLLR